MCSRFRAEKGDILICVNSVAEQSSLKFDGRVEWDVSARRLSWSWWKADENGSRRLYAMTAVFNGNGSQFSEIKCRCLLFGFCSTETRVNQFHDIKDVLQNILQASVNSFGSPEFVEGWVE